jgi:membrane dipeptidase
MNDPELEKRIAEIHRRTVIIDGHCHLMKELMAKRDMGERALFRDYYCPLFREVGIRAIMLITGGDNNSMIKGSDLMLWGTFDVIDYFNQELEECGDVIALCRSRLEIDDALQAGKLVVLFGLEGGRPLEGRPMYDSLSILRILHQLGVRSVQLTGNGRNRLADGIAEAGTNGGLTRFGTAVVKEMQKLNMLLDISHLAPAGVNDVLRLIDGPMVASHSNTRAVCDHPRNLPDELIKEIAQRGGVVGLSLFSTLINKDKNLADVNDLVNHIDHICGLVGPDHVGLGPDFSEFSIQISQWTGNRGNMEGMQYGNKESYFHPDLKGWKQFPNITSELLTRGYPEEAIEKVIGGNFLRLYRQVLQ